MFRKSAESGAHCPLMNRECIREKCMWWTHVRGAQPQTGEPVDHYSCAVAWMPILQIESTQQTRQAGSAIESMRNRMVELATAGRARLTGGPR